ncbi:substrate-binding domain-containing protein [Virgisporangium ochraceum]|nr:substrate-binding domain-containing protein [Virgisporangium ochraceum]
MDGYRLGVDFGTSNTVAVLRWPDGHVRPLLFDGSPLLPSAVFADPAGGLLVGRDAVHAARVDPGSFEPHPKRRVDEGTVLLGAAEVAVTDLFAAVLGRVVAEVDRVAPARPSTVVLTHPASWGPRRRDLLAAAATAVGMAGVRLVPEPVAAAAYLVRMAGVRVPVGGHAVVYDLGAGTFDATVLRRTADGFDVLASRGLDDAGGLDVDAALVESLGAVYRPRDPDVWHRLTAPATPADRRASAQVWNDVRTAKETLSRLAATLVHLPLLDVDAPIGREHLDEVARPVVDRTVEATAAVIRQAGLRPADVAGVFLVGGASRLPLVATRLHATLGLTAFVTEQPELVVAEGSLHAVPEEQPRPQAAPQPAPQAAPQPAPQPAPVAAARTRWWRPALAVAAVLAVANVLLVVVLNLGDDEPGGGPSTATSTSAAAARFTLGFAQASSVGAWRGANTRSVQEAATAANVELVYADADLKLQSQIEAVRSFIARGVDVIALPPVVASGWDAVLGEAKAAGIPVIVLDRPIDTRDTSLYRSLLASDLVAEGRRAGEWVARTFTTGSVAIAELQGTRGSSVTIDRSTGFNDAILASSRLRIAERRTGDFSRSGGQEAMRSILATNPDIDVVFAHNDDMAVGAVQAMVAAGRAPGTDIAVVSIDGVRDAMTELAAGRINYIVECSPNLGPQLMDLARKVHRGEKVPPRVAVEETTFDREQARQALPTRTY